MVRRGILPAVDEKRGGRIADPVHEYVDFTWIERRILDDPITQRLRYVSQNGLAQLVYPEARSSRFSHSLGSMHLASHFLASVFTNSATTSQRKLGNAIDAAIRQRAGLARTYLKATVKELPVEGITPFRSIASAHLGTQQLYFSLNKASVSLPSSTTSGICLSATTSKKPSLITGTSYPLRSGSGHPFSSSSRPPITGTKSCMSASATGLPA
jgi:hypothetical protein